MFKNTKEKGSFLENGIACLCESMSNKGLSNIKIERNIFIEGNSKVKHEIDVMITYVLLNTERRLLIETKNYDKKPVQKQDISTLIAKVNDIPFSSGIIYSVSGYSDGAREFAKYNGIEIFDTNYMSISADIAKNNVGVVLPNKQDIPQPFYTIMLKDNGNNTGIFRPCRKDDKNFFLLFLSENSAKKWITEEIYEIYPVSKKLLSVLCQFAEYEKADFSVFYTNETDGCILSTKTIREYFL